MLRSAKISYLLLYFLFFLFGHSPISNSEIIIRDVETENFIAKLTKPIFRAANLEQESVSIIILKNKEINAFVTGGQNIFLTTETLLQAKDYTEIAAIIAHESGHIAGGHLAKLREKIERESKKAHFANLIGAGVGIITGGGVKAAQGVAGGIQEAIRRNIMAFTRSHEGAADQAALKYLETAKIPAQGYESFLTTLMKRERIRTGNVNPFIQTHPLTKDRLENISNYLKNRKTNQNFNKGLQDQFLAIQAKLYAFLKSSNQTARKYPNKNQQLEDQLANAIVNYKKGKIKKAVLAMDQLIVNSPNNPYLFELKGQMLFENGKLWDSIEAYEQAVKLLPNEALLLMALSQARIATNEKENIVQALKELSRSVNIDSKNITAWYLLSIAYNKIGHQGLSLLSAAEKFILLGDYKTAKNYAKRAKKALPSNSSGKLRAEDILILGE